MTSKSIPGISAIFRPSTKGPGRKAGWEFVVQLTPKASHTKIGDVAFDENGQPYLKAYVTAAPEDNKANQALIALLAKAFRFPKSSFHIVSGLTGRRKSIWIEGETCPTGHQDKWH